MKLINLIPVVISVLSICSISALAAPAAVYDGQFTDVPADAWYAQYVKTAYEHGLMKGHSDTVFAPDGTLSVAEAITIASRIHDILFGGTGDFPAGGSMVSAVCGLHAGT